MKNYVHPIHAIIIKILIGATQIINVFKEIHFIIICLFHFSINPSDFKENSQIYAENKKDMQFV